MKKWSQVIRSAEPITQNHPSKPDDRMLQNATPVRRSGPGPPYISDEHVSCTAPATRNTLQIFLKRPMPANVFETATKPSRFAHFWQGAESLAPATQNHILHPQKVLRDRQFLTLLTSNVLRATMACTFWTSQLPKVLREWCFVYFDFDMCFAPQRRALFRHVNIQKYSGREVLTSKCSLRHNGVQFFISHLPKWLRTRRFSEPTLSSFFWLFLFSDLPFCWLFLFSDSSHLCFSICPYCRKFDSKLPSIIQFILIYVLCINQERAVERRNSLFREVLIRSTDRSERYTSRSEQQRFRNWLILWY